MPNKVSVLDLTVLEKSLNESAVRVSTIWVGFLIFGLYLVVTAGNVTHRQLFLDEAVKLPILNIDLSLAGFFFLAPTLFVVFHAYVLLQVLLLARTAQAYNTSIDHNVHYLPDRERVRQRLVNTLFAQIFAGSQRERGGIVGALLRAVALTTLVISPILVILVFQVKFLPYHSFWITWTHRLLVVLDCGIVLLLWPSVLDAGRNVSWRAILWPKLDDATEAFVLQIFHERLFFVTACASIVISGIVLTYRGEAHEKWTRLLPSTQWGTERPSACRNQHILFAFLPSNFDFLSLPGERFVDDDSIVKIEKSIQSRDRKPYDGEASRNFQGRDLHCGVFTGANLRHADFTRADLSAANLDDVELQGAKLDRAHLEGANLSNASLHGASLKNASLQEAILHRTHLQGATVDGAQLQLAHLLQTELQGASMVESKLQGAELTEVLLQGASLNDAWFVGAKLESVNMQGAVLVGTLFQGAELHDVRFWGADLSLAQFQGAEFGDSQLTLAKLSKTEYCGLNGSTHLPDTKFEGAYIDEAQTSPYIYVSRADQRRRTVGDEREPNESSTPSPRVFYERSLRGSGNDADLFVWRARSGLPIEFWRKLRETVRKNVLQRWDNERLDAVCSEAEMRRAGPANRAGELDEKTQKLAEYHESVAAYLLTLACGKGPSQNYIAEGIISNWLNAPSGAARRPQERSTRLSPNLVYRLASGFLSDTCPAAANLTESREASLRALMDTSL
jgi:uncharacterized protein YjbI with pentapeptide repeats